MADKTKQKKRNLDEVDPLMLASVLNPDLAAAVEQAKQQPRAEVRPARTTRRRVTDEIVGNIKAQFEGKAPVSPWIAYPAAAAVAGTVLNPLTAAESYVLGGLGGAAVDKGTKELTGKSWGKLVSDAADINPEVASVTNPGYLLGGVPITKRSIDTVRALRDASKHGGTLEPNAFGRFIIGGLRKLSNRGKGTQGAPRLRFDNNAQTQSTLALTPGIRQLGLNQRLALPYLQETLPNEYYDYVLAAAQDYDNALVRRGVPYLTAQDIIDNSSDITAAVGIEPQAINAVRFQQDLSPDELAEAINMYIDEGDDFRSVHDRIQQWEEDARFDDAIRRDVAEQAHEFTDNPALDATPNPVQPFDWDEQERAIGIQDYIDIRDNSVQLNEFTESLLDDQRQLNEEVFGVPTNEYIENVRYPANSIRSLADTPPVVQDNTSNSTNSQMQVNTIPSSAVNNHQTVAFSASQPADFSTLTINESESLIREIIKRQIDGKPLSEEQGDFLDWLENNNEPFYRNYETLKGDVDYTFRQRKRYKELDEKIEEGRRNGMSEEELFNRFGRDVAPKLIRTNNRYSGSYRQNSLHGDIDETTGVVDIDGASFFNPDGNPNKLLNATWNDLKKGDIISIANHVGALSRDSYPLYVMNLAKILADKNSKGFKLTRTGTVGLNGLAQSHYKGVALPTQFDPNYTETSKKRIVKAIKALGENYAKKYNTENPFEDIEETLDIGKYRSIVPAFIIEKLKLGGYVPRRMLATGGSIHINPANRGKFNATKARTGKTTEELTHSKNPLTRKRAIFAQNAAKWNH